MKINMTKNQATPGCVFEHCGTIPESEYSTEVYNSPLEKAVWSNNTTTFKQLVQEGHLVSVKLKIGNMSCIEYAAMKGHTEILKLLLEESVNANTLKQYFSLDDVVERAYLISRNKRIFFNQEALAEANRYEAALYTAIVYDQPSCIEVLLHHLGARELDKHAFYTNGADPQKLSPCELAKAKGHMECYQMLCHRQEQPAV